MSQPEQPRYEMNPQRVQGFLTLVDAELSTVSVARGRLLPAEYDEDYGPNGNKIRQLAVEALIGHLCEHKTARSGLYMPRTILDHVQIDVLLRYLEGDTKKGLRSVMRTGIRSADGVTRARETVSLLETPRYLRSLNTRTTRLLQGIPDVFASRVAKIVLRMPISGELRQPSLPEWVFADTDLSPDDELHNAALEWVECVFESADWHSKKLALLAIVKGRPSPVPVTELRGALSSRVGVMSRKSTSRLDDAIPSMDLLRRLCGDGENNPPESIDNLEAYTMNYYCLDPKQAHTVVCRLLAYGLELTSYTSSDTKKRDVSA